MGLVPKSGRGWQLIVDLSSPHNASVNDGINSELCSLRYAAIDQALLFSRQLGRGSLLVKLAKSKKRLPAGPSPGPPGRSAPPRCLLARCSLHRYCLAISAQIRTQDFLRNRGCCGLGDNVQRYIHYLDDFLIMEPPGCDATHSYLSTALATCAKLHFPVATEKTTGP